MAGVCCTLRGAGGQCVLPNPQPSTLNPHPPLYIQAVLVGDPLQLPPVVQSRSAAAEGLAVSLFERLLSLGVRYTGRKLPGAIIHWLLSPWLLVNWQTCRAACLTSYAHTLLLECAD